MKLIGTQTAKACLERMSMEMFTKVEDSKINLGNNLVELSKTVELFHNIGRILKDVTGLRWYDLWKRGFRDPREWSKTVSSSWLQYAYGIRPLLSDLYSLVTSLDDNSFDIGQKKVTCSKSCTSNGRGYLLVANKKMTSISTSSSGPGYRMVFDDGSVDGLSVASFNALIADGYTAIPLKLVTRATYRSTYRLRVSREHTLAQLGLTNPLEWIWEAIPFSFVVDWWLQIGSYLGSIDSLYGVMFKNRCDSSSIEYRLTAPNGSGFSGTRYTRTPVVGSTALTEPFSSPFAVSTVGTRVGVPGRYVLDGKGLSLANKDRLASAMALVLQRVL
jgi:hypothetical protein